MQRNKGRSAGRFRATIGKLALAASLPLAACETDSFLTVVDPDLINPEDISTAAGAEAIRLGALSRFIGTTTGSSGGTFTETLFVWSGELADEWQTGDTFAQRLQVDQRAMEITNTGVDNGLRNAHRARLSAQQAVDALRRFAPSAPAWQVAEMYFVQGYVENMLGEYFCSGMPFSTVVNGEEQFGSQTTTAQTFERALAHADSALALVATGSDANTVRVRNAVSVLRGRILLNQGNFAQAAAAVTGVPTTFAYTHQHSQTTRDNVNWLMNNNSRRYTMGDREGGNGLPFFSAQDPRLPSCLAVTGAQGAACRAAGITATSPFNTFSPTPLRVQLKWRNRTDPITIADGIEARLIEAEAAMNGGQSAAGLPILNALRTTVTGLAPLTDTGTPAGRVDQLFRERAFWMFGTGHRLGDMRRLVRQYGRTQDQVFPVGNFAEGGTYGSEVNFPITQSEANNPMIPQGTNLCLDRKA